jgi:peptide/nickel transport system substrate-binding protein
VAYAIDKEKILDGMAWGLGVVADQKMLKGSPWYVPLQERKRDLEKARSLLREAGFPNGVRVKAQIEKRNEAEALLIQGQLKEAGIELELEFMDFAKHQNDLRDGTYHITTFGGSTSIDPDLNHYANFHTESQPRKISNMPRYSNPRVDRLLEQGRAETDSQKRYRIYKEVVEIIHEELPQITVGFTPYIFAYRAHVKNFRSDPSGVFFYGTGGLAMAWMDR